MAFQDHLAAARGIGVHQTLKKLGVGIVHRHGENLADEVLEAVVPREVAIQDVGFPAVSNQDRHSRMHRRPHVQRRFEWSRNRDLQHSPRLKKARVAAAADHHAVISGVLSLL